MHQDWISQKLPKSIYSIHRKMVKQGIPFEEVFDAFAIRVIVNSPLFLEKADCWRVYSIITDKYRSHEGRLRDWLSHPKNNGYSALHTTVLGPKGRWVEVQIRTLRMDELAENAPNIPSRMKGKFKELKNREHKRIFHLTPTP